MACEEQSFSGVTVGHFARFAERARSMGMPTFEGQGPVGEVTEMGVTLRWAFVAEQGTLTIQCMKSPMLLPCALINAKIKEQVEAVLQETGATGGASVPA
jgi:hypothetical protein